MVAVIHQSASLHRAMNYNHHKEVQGKATCILAINYPKDPDEMSFYQKLHRLTNQAALNQRTKVNSVHISLNFSPSEKLSVSTLSAIAQTYMEKIGFGDQPYLVYEHRDAGHPHVHIVTTNIRADGKRISLHNLGKNQSEHARKTIEKEFNMLKSESKNQQLVESLVPVAIKKVLYGQSETKRSITNVLDAVLPKYKFKSLAELNAVLRQANVQASRGMATSRTYQQGGLLYQILDAQGKPVGIPIKASSIYSKPTLKELTKIFEANAIGRLGQEKHIKTSVDWYFLKSRRPSLEQLKDALGKEGIVMTEYIAKNGQTFGITYVDHRTGTVFKASDLGKEYTAKGLENRIAHGPIQKPIATEGPKRNPMEGGVPSSQQKSSFLEYIQPMTRPSSVLDPTSGTDDLPSASPGSLPYELRNNERKKRRKKRLHL